jgi:hypothetical protein
MYYQQEKYAWERFPLLFGNLRADQDAIHLVDNGPKTLTIADVRV